MLSHKTFQSKCDSGTKLTTVTCYDYWSAKLLKDLPIDMVLVGDSVAMVMHGYDSTIHATVEMIESHTAAVARGLGGKLWLIADMPFGSFRQGKAHALEVALKFLRAGAHSVKIEAVRGHEDVIEHLVQSGVPVMGHLGLTPQSHLTLGGHKVQGKKSSDAELIMEDALVLERLGCYSVVLECVPSGLGKKISDELRIPTIGIGAGVDTDGQILVLQDLLGAQENFKPKFLRNYAQLNNVIKEALLNYAKDVGAKSFPSKEESYL